MKKVIDAMGLACPMPVIEAKKAAEAMNGEGALVVKVDNEIAVENLKKFAQSKGYSSESETLGKKEFEVTIKISDTDTAEDAKDEEVCDCVPVFEKNTVVVLSSNVMGTGDDTLGGNLMKAFVFALTQTDELPKTVLCYNGGAKLTCEDSPCLEDFKLLEKEGVEILTCGTCLDFYGLKEKLSVGGVTNMYEIVEKQEKATLVIRP